MGTWESAPAFPVANFSWQWHMGCVPGGTLVRTYLFFSLLFTFTQNLMVGGVREMTEWWWEAGMLTLNKSFVFSDMSVNWGVHVTNPLCTWAWQDPVQNGRHVRWRGESTMIFPHQTSPTRRNVMHDPGCTTGRTCLEGFWVLIQILLFKILHYPFYFSFSIF